ncbi:hypothetical protein LSS_21480 [Leptospira santarosai serovar Shermani str. LT 821]|uniref:Uncharacterized protein n=2 Tax=Leptospira santarosai TaxID=28183 RepID=A0A097ESG9_9LEPT|nr:hypothetical protein LSS_21480 [Leptospira santarosai serovar Shermani str. LT 821]
MVEGSSLFSCDTDGYPVTKRIRVEDVEENDWTILFSGLEIKEGKEMVKTLRLELPDGLNLNEQALRMTLAVKLYEAGQCSLGQAASVAGVTKRSFIETMGAFGGSVFSGYTTDDYLNDIKNA